MPLTVTNMNPIEPGEQPEVLLDAETSSTSFEPPALPQSEREGEEGAAQPSVEKKFEWNVERLFVRNPEHSQSRTWFVRFLGLFIAIPTLLLDLGRYLAFSVGLVNGKSYSLIDKTSDACQALAAKVKAFMAPKELTLEEQNELAKQRIETHAHRFVEGYRKLNGGYFHTNSSFSSPYALNAEKQIRREKAALVREVNEYVAKNAESPEDFVKQVEVAKRIVFGAIDRVAGDDFYIANKVERFGEPDLLRDVANDEFSKALEVSNKGLLAENFVNIATKAGSFASSIRRGVETGVLSPVQAKEAVLGQAQSIYLQGLETGIEEAEKILSHHLDSAIQEGLISQNESALINAHIQPAVEVLAIAAARDLARINPPEVEIPNRLISIAKDLQSRNRLEEEDVSKFLTSAEGLITEAKEQVEAEQLKAKEEAGRIEAENLEALQKAAEQHSLYTQFNGMLGLIANRQDALTSQFLNYDQMEIDRRKIAEELETTRNAMVAIDNEEITILDAADLYFKKLSKISQANLTPIQREEQMNALEDEGFTKATIDQIQKLKDLTPRLHQITRAQGASAREIELRHDELARLRAVYGVFKKNHFGRLNTENRKTVVAREVQVNRAQKTLNERHRQLVGATGIIARMRYEEPSIPVNVDPQGNQLEVETLLRSAEQAEKREDEASISVSLPRPFYRRWFDSVTSPFRGVRA